MFTITIVLKGLTFFFSFLLGNLPQSSLIPAPVSSSNLPLLVMMMPPNLAPNYIASHCLSMGHVCLCIADLPSAVAMPLTFLCLCRGTPMNRGRQGYRCEDLQVCVLPCQMSQRSARSQGAWDPAADALSCSLYSPKGALPKSGANGFRNSLLASGP